ncbi:hypothetical protein JNW88_08255 [Micromonospora sp. ATA32]|nr:hypothetical protein [Micromonospora sp. ATA32]
MSAWRWRTNLPARYEAPVPHTPTAPLVDGDRSRLDAGHDFAVGVSRASGRAPRDRSTDAGQDQP